MLTSFRKLPFIECKRERDPLASFSGLVTTEPDSTGRYERFLVVQTKSTIQGQFSWHFWSSDSCGLLAISLFIQHTYSNLAVYYIL